MVARLLPGVLPEVLIEHGTHHLEDGEIGQASIQEGRHACLVGGVEDCRGGPSRLPCPACDADGREGGVVHGLELPGRRLGPIAPGSRLRDSVGPGEGPGDRETHVGRAGLGQGRSIGELHHGVHDRLRMHNDIDAIEGDVKEQMRLDDLQALVDQCRGVDRDEGAHRPGGVCQRLLGSHGSQLLAGPSAEGPAARREDEPIDLRTGTGHEALGEGRVLGIDRPDLTCAGALAHQRTADDERLLIGKCQRGASLEGPQRRHQPGSARQSIENHIAGLRGQVRRLIGADSDLRDPVGPRLLGKEVPLGAASREAHDPESVRIPLDHVEGLAANRARAPEDDHLSTLGHAPIVLRSCP